ncbi:MAG: response regulator transcription factor [Bacteroidales bacterium]|nr:response regulator transcription factor [Bacteroidales bacterium]
MKTNQRILVVDDESVLCDVLRINLELAGYKVDTATSAEEALRLDLSVYDMLILDVMMDKMNGFDLAKTIRSNHALTEVPIIFCTALDSEADLLKGFGTGADDYIKKPFSMNELIVRVKSILRRYEKPDKSIMTYKGMTISHEERRLVIDGEELSLTKKEFDLLWYLMSNANQIFTREALLTAVWEDDVLVVDRTIDVNINRLRKKLGSYGNNIITKSGCGYGFKTYE